MTIEEKIEALENMCKSQAKRDFEVAMCRGVNPRKKFRMTIYAGIVRSFLDKSKKIQKKQ